VISRPTSLGDQIISAEAADQLSLFPNDLPSEVENGNEKVYRSVGG
jgi:hypothetical protein